MAHGLQQRPMVSAIMTLRDAERTLERATESVLSQPVSDLQLVLVVLPSSDRTLSMAQRLRDRDFRVDVVELDADDPFAAADAGFDAARGRFITFMHQTDWFGVDGLARMARAASEHDLELVIPSFSFDSYRGSHRVSRSYRAPVMQALDVEEIRAAMHRYIEDDAFGMLAGKLLQHDRIERLGLRMFLSGNEEAYMLGYFENLSSVLVVDDATFHTDDPLARFAAVDPTTRYQLCERDHACLLRLQHVWGLDADAALTVAIHRRHLRQLIGCIKDMATQRKISSIERTDRVRDMIEAASTRQTLAALQGSTRLHREFGLMYEPIARGNVAACCLGARFSEIARAPRLPFGRQRS